VDVCRLPEGAHSWEEFAPTPLGPCFLCTACATKTSHQGLLCTIPNLWRAAADRHRKSSRLWPPLADDHGMTDDLLGRC
jgi:hypothetical protein